MCFSRPTPPTPPPPPPLPSAPKPPPPPVAPPKAPEPLQNQDQPASIKTKQSKRDRIGAVSQGTSQLRIPLNQNTTPGGLNL